MFLRLIKKKRCAGLYLCAWLHVPQKLSESSQCESTYAKFARRNAQGWAHTAKFARNITHISYRVCPGMNAAHCSLALFHHPAHCQKIVIVWSNEQFSLSPAKEPFFMVLGLHSGNVPLNLFLILKSRGAKTSIPPSRRSQHIYPDPGWQEPQFSLSVT